MENAEAMKQTRVSGAWINKIRKPKLLNSSQALEWARLNNAPKHLFDLRPINVKLNKIVNGITNALLLSHSPNLPHPITLYHRTK
ncbi:hypothetical protein CHELA40_50677 [Chelatococcus asaccharovorans]|nr:hypothetical protein CHELA17_20645 [Chelatococcus asaccharovorans]CAH1693844.1 hypothetical protein CHELA40_50677 [Chelatococcus asaccharovorans]